MEEFSFEWVYVDDIKILYSRPYNMVDHHGYEAHYNDLMAEYGEDVGLFIVDLLDIREDMGIEGFRRNITLIKKYGFKKVRYGVVSHDSQYELLVKLFSEVAANEGVDAVANAFQSVDEAKTWLISKC